jgi:glutathione synthase/RimK-type ligase-like ATP-grasp enzyme
MSSHIIIVERKKDWKAEFPEAEVVTAKDYLSKPEFLKNKGAKVINLCRSYRYQSIGYYCSLLGEARRHKVIPSIDTITDLSSKAIYSLNLEDLHSEVQKSLKKRNRPQDENQFEMIICFGQCQEKTLQELARQIFDLFHCPLLKVEFRLQGNWNITSVKPMMLHNLHPELYNTFAQAFNTYLGKRWRLARSRSIPRYDLAILYNPQENIPPSSSSTLKKFVSAGKKLNINVELIEKKDFSKLAEYDALFIRETTKIDHHTFRFAKKAETEGMVVMDDPASIVKCTNKVYLAELLAMNKVPIPKTIILQKDNISSAPRSLGFPIVLKEPDSSFSRGVSKAENEQQLQRIVERSFKESDLILAQEYLYTAFDWRIGVLNRQAIYACQYFMSKKHWQIVKYGPSGRFTEGGYKTFAIKDAPQMVVDIALKAANLIGDGLYGVDLKQTEDGVYVIEINDNPNLDSGVEDAVLGDTLYSLIMEEFIRRLDRHKAR